MEFSIVPSKDKLGGHGAIQKRLNQLPKTPKHKRCSVNHTDCQGLWVIILKALDKETDKAPIHIVEPEIGKVKDNDDSLGSERENGTTALHCLHTIVGMKWREEMVRK